MGSAGCQSFRPLTVALRQTVATSFARLHEPHPQRFVRAHKMIVRAPPLQMGHQVWGLLSSGLGPASKGGHAMAHRQIYPFDKCGVQPTREA